MPKTKEEINQLKIECKSLITKLKELNEDELKEVLGGENEMNLEPFALSHGDNKAEKDKTHPGNLASAA